MLFALRFIFIFIIGGLNRVVLTNISIDTAFYNIYYIVAHFHYILNISAVFAMFNKWYFWILKILGLNYNLKLS